MPSGSIVKVQIFGERPDYMPPAESKYPQTPDGLITYADEDADQNGALLRFYERTGGLRTEFIDRLHDGERKEFYTRRATRANPRNNWVVSTKDGRLGIRYSILIEFDDSSCYIASACFGDADAAEVMFFRRFRNDVLIKTPIGRQCITYYYEYSPTLANLIRQSTLARTITRHLVLRPLMSFLKLFCVRGKCH